MANDFRIKLLAEGRLQAQRLAFERDKIAYEQNAQHLRSLNQYLWQVPTIAITLTGGLWYGVTNIDEIYVRCGLLLLAAVSDLLLIVVLLRIRFIFNQYLDVQRQFNAKYNIAKEDGPWKLPSKTVVYCFSAMLAIGAVGSLGYLVWDLKQGPVAKPSPIAE